MDIDDRFWMALGGETRTAVAAGITAALVDGADPNAPCDDDGHSPLYWAADSGEVDYVQLLLDVGSRPSAEQSTEGTSLHVAAENGAVEIVRVLLSAGCDAIINRFDYLARTPLGAACAGAHLQVAQALIEAGAHLDARDESRSGNTPLSMAVEEGHPQIVELLLHAGANPTIPGWMGLTSIHRAQQRQDEAGDQILALIQRATGLSGGAWQRLLLP